jgi:hypothetical protein
MSNNYSLKQNLNKLCGFYFIDSKAVHTANASNNLNGLYSTIIDYIILSKSSQTYCFSYYAHGSGFSEQCSVLNNIPYTVFYMNSNNIVNPDYVLLDYNINDNIHYNNISFITLTNDGYIDYTLNCIKSLNDIDIKQKLKVYCIGNNGYSILQQNNISCELIMDEKANKFQEFRTGNWSNVTYYKFQIIYENLLNNEYVCFTDGDIVYENKHIFLFLLNNIKDNDILIQDENLDETLCSGFMFIKSNKNTISLFNPENVKKYINTVGWDDQIYINNIKHLIKYQKLPLYLFPTGAYYYNYNNVIANPYLIHFNWVIGNEKKNKMIYYNKWYLRTYIATPYPDCGIGSVIVCIIGALYYLKQNNINAVLIVNCINASETAKVFIDCFLDKDNIKCVKFVNIYDDFYKINNNEANIYKELFYVNETTYIYDKINTDFNKCLEIFNNLWILKPFVKNDCECLEQYDICINIRRGDKITLEPHLSIASIDAYINEINKINITNPKIFHTSDYYNTFLEIKTKNVDWDISTLTSPEENGYFLRDINKKKDRQYNVKHVEKFMKQLHIMKNSEYFIGSISTNVCNLVQLLRQVNSDEKNIYFSR